MASLCQFKKAIMHVNYWFASIGCFFTVRIYSPPVQIYVRHRQYGLRTVFLSYPVSGLVNCFVFAVQENSTSSLSAYFMTRENKRLEGHVGKRLESASLMSCSHLCLRNSWCTSTNFEAPSGDNGRGTCELNKHGAINTESEFYEQQGVTFSMFQKVNSTLLNRDSKLFIFGKIFRKFSNIRHYSTALYC